MHKHWALVYRILVLTLLATNLLYLNRIWSSQYTGPGYTEEQQVRGITLDLEKIVEQLKSIERNTRRP